MSSEAGNSPEEALAYVKKVPPRQGASMANVPFEQLDTVRIGWIGVGGRGTGLLKEVLAVPGAQIVAIFDAVAANAERARGIVVEQGQGAPVITSSYEELCARDDIDLVYICTRWDQHGETRLFLCLFSACVAADDSPCLRSATGTLRYGARASRRSRGPSCHHSGRLLEAGRHIRAHTAPLHHPRELLLR